MRVSFFVYGVLYVVIEMIGRQLDAIGWPQLTALDVATAVVNALLVVSVGIAVLVAVDFLGHRWRRWLRTWQLEQARLEQAQEPITVRAWRPGPLALSAGPGAQPRTDHPYAPNAYTDPQIHLL